MLVPQAHRASAASLARLLVLSVLLVSAPVTGANDRETELARVRARLQALQTDLNATRNKRDGVREQINDLERDIGSALNQLRAIDKRLRIENRRLGALRARATAQRNSLDEQREGLARQLRAQYAAGRQEQLKLLLKQQDPATAARVLTYYRYVHRARAERISTIRETLSDLQEVEARLEEKQTELRALREDQQRDNAKLEANRKRRAVLLASLDRRVTAQSQAIERLREDEARLTRLLQEITSAYADIPLPREIKGAFGSLKGKLALPTPGRLLARYGDPKPVGNLKWRGLFLSAADGAPVRAIARGRVAYADWLRGFGLILIVEHGDGYMSLYGHNQSLSKQAGEWVDAGETIARVGNTGDAPQSGLYFEVRHNGEPRDPLLWCRVR